MILPCIKHGYVDCFKALCFTACSGCFSIMHFTLPAISLYMRLVRQLRLLECCARRTRCSPSFLYQFHLNCFYTFCKIFRSCRFSVFCPVKPAVTLCICSVIDIIMFSQFSRQADLYCFHSFSAVWKSCRYIIALLSCPSITLHICIVYDISTVLRIINSCC